MKKLLRDIYESPHFKNEIIQKLVENQIKSLIRETPGDAQYVEITGSMIRRRTVNHSGDEHDVYVPMTIVAHNYPGDPEEFSARSEHVLTISTDQFEIGWVDMSDDLGYGQGPEIREPSDWSITEVDGCTIEQEDEAKIKAYLKSRPDILVKIMEEISNNVVEKAAEDGPSSFD